jgi:FkbM family methyltransferase
MSEEQPGNDNAKHDSLSGEYEKHFKIVPGCLVLDLGAHVGYFSEHALNKGARVIAVEPHPDNYKALLERVGYRASIVMNKAASNFTGAGILYQCDLNSGAHSLFKHELCGCVSHQVTCIDIGEFLKRNNIAPDFIKIDTESSEVDILNSLLFAGIRTNMAIEVHDPKLYFYCRGMAETNNMEWEPKTTHVGICYCWPK